MWVPRIQVRRPSGVCARCICRKDIFSHAGPHDCTEWHLLCTFETFSLGGDGRVSVILGDSAWMQVQEKMVQKSVKCTLLTGQEIEQTAKDTHVSCTVEMANISKPYEVALHVRLSAQCLCGQVAVVDEYQLMSDPSRGWAFTRAILGLPAKRVYVCGHPSALALLNAMCQETGDALQVTILSDSRSSASSRLSDSRD